MSLVLKYFSSEYFFQKVKKCFYFSTAKLEMVPLKYMIQVKKQKTPRMTNTQDMPNCPI